MTHKFDWAYIIGIALGDGNLSNPNGRAIRLRVTCDASYPVLARTITRKLQKILPTNSVSVIRGAKASYFNISVYSNQLDHWIPWTCGQGSKIEQQARVPLWIKRSDRYSRECLRGLLQTDGSIYVDRGYTMVNFCNVIEPLATDVHTMLTQLGFKPTLSRTQDRKRMKYTVRVAKDTERLISHLRYYKK